MSIETSVQIPSEPRDKPLIRTSTIIIGVVITLVIVGLLIWGIIWLARNAAMEVEAVRDILIIALALESCIFGIVLLLLLVMVIRLVNMLEFEIKPILEKTNDTVGMIRGTTVFVSQNVVKPVTTATAYMAAVRTGLRTLFGDPRRNLGD